MIGEKLRHTEIRKAQQDDEFAQMMVERCSRADASKDKRASKFMVIDGALYRVTSSGDPQDGRESQRIYVPLELRAALMRNYHSTAWAKHQHSRSMHKKMVAWYYWSTMEKDIQEYVSTCELCQLAKGTKHEAEPARFSWRLEAQQGAPNCLHGSDWSDRRGCYGNFVNRFLLEEAFFCALRQRPTQPPTGGGLSWWLWLLPGGHANTTRRRAKK